MKLLVALALSLVVATPAFANEAQVEETVVRSQEEAKNVLVDAEVTTGAIQAVTTA